MIIIPVRHGLKSSRGATITPSDGIAVLKEISRTFSEYVKQLRGIGTNVNQMAHVANGHPCHFYMLQTGFLKKIHSGSLSLYSDFGSP